MSGAQKITVQLRQPRGNDPGKVEIGYFIVTNDHVVLTDADGRSIGGEKRRIEEGGVDAKTLACAMLRKRSASSARPGGFDGKLSYPKLRY